MIFVSNLLRNNPTYYSEVYHGREYDIFIPKHSYFDSECCMTAATFYSLRTKSSLQKEIDNYLKDFEFFENDSTYGYRKDNIFIQKYEVEEHILYRKIIIVY